MKAILIGGPFDGVVCNVTHRCPTILAATAGDDGFTEHRYERVTSPATPENASQLPYMYVGAKPFDAGVEP